MKKPFVSKSAKMSATKPYPVIVHADASGQYWVECLGIEGCYSQGKTIDEALHNIREAIDLCLEDMPRSARRSFADVSLHFVAA